VAVLASLAEHELYGPVPFDLAQQEINSIERGQRTNVRVPPGKNMAHRRGFEAKNGYSYEHSDLQDIDLHKLQHKHEGY
jgi:hypothetical protein